MKASLSRSNVSSTSPVTTVAKYLVLDETILKQATLATQTATDPEAAVSTVPHTQELPSRVVVVKLGDLDVIQVVEPGTPEPLATIERPSPGDPVELNPTP